jgi:hypothetical protein
MPVWHEAEQSWQLLRGFCEGAAYKAPDSLLGFNLLSVRDDPRHWDSQNPSSHAGHKVQDLEPRKSPVFSAKCVQKEQ